MPLPRFRAITSRSAVLAALAAAGLLALTACTASTSRPTATSASPVPAVEVTPSSTPAPTPVTAAPSAAAPTPSTSSKAPAALVSTSCGTADLAVTLASAGGGAGSRFATLTFTNRGSIPCTLSGFPGVSYIAGPDQHQVGAPAVRAAGAARGSLRLVAGGRVTAAVRMGNPHVYPESQCRPVAVNGLRVFPPGQTVAAVVRLPAGTDACSATLLAGGPQLNVGPVQRS